MEWIYVRNFERNMKEGYVSIGLHEKWNVKEELCLGLKKKREKSTSAWLK